MKKIIYEITYTDKETGLDVTLIEEFDSLEDAKDYAYSIVDKGFFFTITEKRG